MQLKNIRKRREGAQDNQFNDVVSFLENSIGLQEQIAIAIVDGDYYDQCKINKLKQINPEAVIISGFELEGWLNER